MNLLDKYYTCHVYSMTTTHLKRNMMKTKKNKKIMMNKALYFTQLLLYVEETTPLALPYYVALFYRLSQSELRTF